MQLNGVGGKSTNISISSTVKQVGSNENRPIQEVKVIGKKAEIVEQKKSISEEKRYTKDEVYENVEKANKMVAVYDRRFEISIHDKTKQVMVKVIDSTTDEVIREIPSEKVLDMVAGFMEIAGIIVDKRI